VAKELMALEQDYCNTLQTMQDAFAQPLKASGIVQQTDLKYLSNSSHIFVDRKINGHKTAQNGLMEFSTRCFFFAKRTSAKITF